jgi:DNA helicase-2/ATP-dependent DNA helicase PcrA
MENEEAIEEERRLAYVAITRARKKLHITSARSRMLFGQTQELPPSRFIREIDPQYVESIGVGRRSFVDEAPAQRSNQSGAAYGSGALGQAGSAYGSGTGHSGSASRPFGSTVFGAPQKASAGSTAPDPNCLSPEAVRQGMEVRHPRFGKGVVTSVEKVAGDALVCVVFENKTTRNMLVRQAKLVIA